MAFCNCYVTIEKFEPSEKQLWIVAYKPGLVKVFQARAVFNKLIMFASCKIF